MFSGNFRVLIFIDLLATAMGGSLILMMILSISKNQSAPPAGAARSFISYKVWTDDADAYLKLIVKNGNTEKWFGGTIPELKEATSDIFIIDEKEEVFAWGPVTEYDSANRVIAHNVFNVYSTANKEGNWVLGVLYYNNKNLNEGNAIDPANTEIKVHHQWQTMADPEMLEKEDNLSIGNYSFRTVNLKIPE